MGGIYEVRSYVIGSGAMIYIPSLIKIGSGIQKLMGGGIHRQHGDRINSATAHRVYLGICFVGLSEETYKIA
jgi:hypothetical protein